MSRILRILIYTSHMALMTSRLLSSRSVQKHLIDHLRYSEKLKEEGSLSREWKRSTIIPNFKKVDGEMH